MVLLPTAKSINGGTRIRSTFAMPVQHDTIAPHNSHHIAASAEIKESDAEYLAKHNIRALMADMVQEIVVAKPVSPVQFMIDYLAVGSSLCQQDKYGLSMMRRARLMKIFKAWDKNQDKTVDLKELRAFTRKHGGNAVTQDELKDIFMDMDESGDSKVDEDEFLKFFSLSVKRMDDDEFEQMIQDMLQ